MARKPVREAREWNVILIENDKKPREIPVNFPPFDVTKLGLELLESPFKVRPNAPTTITIKRPLAPAPSEAAEALLSSEEDISDEEFSKALSAASGGEDSSDEEILPKSLRSSGASSEESSDEGEEGEEREILSILASTDGEEEKLQEPTPVDAQPPKQTPEERKTELLRKWKILAVKYPTSNEVRKYSFGDEDPLDVIEKAYNEVTWDLSFKSKVQHYRQILGFYTGGVEFAATNFFEIDMTGFAYSQSQMMSNVYDELLVELGEKSGETFYSKLPVEVRLLATVAAQTALFFGFRYIHNNRGAAYGAMYRQQFGIASPEPPPKPRMGGPSITPEDLERLRREAEEKED